jgi:hypothetical protein
MGRRVIIVLASLALFDVWDRALDVSTPLMAIVLTLQAIQEWKKNKGIAIFSLCAAIFVFGCAIAVWVIK